MGGSLENRYVSVRKKLDELGYREAFGIESLTLVERLLRDVLTTSEKFKETLNEAKTYKKLSRELEEGVEPFKEENLRLIKENSHLRLAVQKNEEKVQEKLQGWKSRLRDLEAENADLKLLITEFVDRVKKQEVDSLEKTRRLAQLQEKNLQAAVIFSDGRKQIVGQRQQMEIDAPAPQLCPHCTRIRNLVQCAKNADPTAVDYLKVADSRIEALTIQNRTLRTAQQDLLELIKSLKKGIEMREGELEKMKENLRFGMTITGVNKGIIGGGDNDIDSHPCKDLQIALKSAQLQLQILQKRNLNLEKKLQNNLLSIHDDFVLNRNNRSVAEKNLYASLIESDECMFLPRDNISTEDKLMLLEKQLSHCCQEKAKLKALLEDCERSHRQRRVSPDRLIPQDSKENEAEITKKSTKKSTEPSKGSISSKSNAVTASKISAKAVSTFKSIKRPTASSRLTTKTSLTQAQSSLAQKKTRGSALASRVSRPFEPGMDDERPTSEVASRQASRTRIGTTGVTSKVLKPASQGHVGVKGVASHVVSQKSSLKSAVSRDNKESEAVLARETASSKSRPLPTEQYVEPYGESDEEEEITSEEEEADYIQDEEEEEDEEEQLRLNEDQIEAGGTSSAEEEDGAMHRNGAKSHSSMSRQSRHSQDDDFSRSNGKAKGQKLASKTHQDDAITSRKTSSKLSPQRRLLDRDENLEEEGEEEFNMEEEEDTRRPPSKAWSNQLSRRGPSESRRQDYDEPEDRPLRKPTASSKQQPSTQRKMTKEGEKRRDFQEQGNVARKASSQRKYSRPADQEEDGEIEDQEPSRRAQGRASAGKRIQDQESEEELDEDEPQPASQTVRQSADERRSAKDRSKSSSEKDLTEKASGKGSRSTVPSVASRERTPSEDPSRRSTSKESAKSTSATVVRDRSSSKEPSEKEKRKEGRQRSPGTPSRSPSKDISKENVSRRETSPTKESKKSRPSSKSRLEHVTEEAAFHDPTGGPTGPTDIRAETSSVKLRRSPAQSSLSQYSKQSFSEQNSKGRPSKSSGAQESKGSLKSVKVQPKPRGRGKLLKQVTPTAFGPEDEEGFSSEEESNRLRSDNSIQDRSSALLGPSGGSETDATGKSLSESLGRSTTGSKNERRKPKESETTSVKGTDVPGRKASPPKTAKAPQSTNVAIASSPPEEGQSRRNEENVSVRYEEAPSVTGEASRQGADKKTSLRRTPSTTRADHVSWTDVSEPGLFHWKAQADSKGGTPLGTRTPDEGIPSVMGRDSELQRTDRTLTHDDRVLPARSADPTEWRPPGTEPSRDRPTTEQRGSLKSLFGQDAKIGFGQGGGRSQEYDLYRDIGTTSGYGGSRLDRPYAETRRNEWEVDARSRDSTSVPSRMDQRTLDERFPDTRTTSQSRDRVGFDPYQSFSETNRPTGRESVISAADSRQPDWRRVVAAVAPPSQRTSRYPDSVASSTLPSADYHRLPGYTPFPTTSVAARQDGDDLYNKIRMLERTIDNLQVEANRAKASKADLEQEVLKLRRALAECQEHGRQLTAENQKTKIMLEHTEALLKETQRKAAVNYVPTQRENQELNLQVRQLMAKEMGRERELASLTATIKALDRDKDEMRVELDRKDEKLARLQAENAQLSEQVRSMQLQLKNAELKLGHHGETTRDQEREMMQLRRQMADLRADLEHRIKERDAAQRELNRLNQSSSKHELENRNMTVELERRGKEADELKKQVQKYIDEVRRIEELLLNKEEELEHLMESYRALSQEKVMLESQQSLLEREAATVRSDAVEVMESTAQLSSQLISKQQVLQAYEQEIEQLSNQVASMESQLRTTQDREKTLQTDLKAARDLCLKLESNLDSVRLNAATTDSLKNKIQADNNELRSLVEMLEAQLSGEAESRKKLEDLIAKMREKEYQAEAAMNALKSDKESLNSRLASLQSRTEHVTGEMEKHRLKAAELQAELEKIRRQFNSEKIERDAALAELKRIQAQLSTSSTSLLLTSTLAPSGTSSPSPYVPSQLSGIGLAPPDFSPVMQTSFEQQQHETLIPSPQPELP